jgi:hypothetical protein
MAELLLNEMARVRLARVLEDKHCPLDLDRKTYHALQRGERSAVSFRHITAILQAHGDLVAQAIPGLKPEARYVVPPSGARGSS